MANASLQIGNGNWAIKENDLLGYSKSGTRFLPIPITMTRATLGTRFNPSGLIEDVELLGSEEVENGDGSSTTGWDLAYANTTLSINNNNLRATANGSGAYGLSQDLSLDTNKQYIIKATINVDNASGGAANLRIATNSNLSSNVTTLSSTTGTTTTILSPSATTMYIGIVDTANDSSNYVEIDNISVKEVTRDGLARVDYTDGTGSLLVEPQRTNQALNSNDISLLNDVVIGDGVVSKTSNYAISPDGTQNATRVVASSTASNYALVSLTAVSSTTGTYVGSVYLKSNNGANQNVAFYGRNSVVTYVTITPNWERYNVLGSTSSNFINFGSRTSYGSDSSLDFLAWGLQIEHGSYATSYIKTQGSTVTRNQDEYTKTGISDKINSEEGVLFAEMAALDNDLTTRMISLSDGGNSNRIHMFYHSVSNEIAVNYRVSGTTESSLAFVVSNITNFNKIAFKWKSADFALWINGVEVGTDSNTTMLPADTLNKLAFEQGNGGNDLYAKVKQLQVFKTALSDSELATLTTI
jgi:hypothetical protein